MKIKTGFVLRKIGDSYVALATGSDLINFNAMISTNETGAFLWNNLLDDTTIGELAQKLSEEYDVSTETAHADISEFIDKLKSANLLDQ